MYFYIAVCEEPITDDMFEKANQLCSKEAYRLTDNALLLQSHISDPGVFVPAFRLDDSFGDDSNIGVVLKLNGSYMGYHHSKLWDWLDAIKEAAVG